MRFGDLKTGDVMELAGTKAVVMAIQREHPRDPRYMLVVWYLMAENRLTFDMLSAQYEMVPGSSVTSDGLLTWIKITNELAAPQ